MGQRLHVWAPAQRKDDTRRETDCVIVDCPPGHLDAAVAKNAGHPIERGHPTITSSRFCWIQVESASPDQPHMEILLCDHYNAWASAALRSTFLEKVKTLLLYSSEAAWGFNNQHQDA